MTTAALSDSHAIEVARLSTVFESVGDTALSSNHAEREQLTVAEQVAKMCRLVEEMRNSHIVIEALEKAGKGKGAPSACMPLCLKSSGCRQLMLKRIRRGILAADVGIHAHHLDRVLQTMASIDRELFVKPERAEFAYLPFAMAIGYGQTISQPHNVAAMTVAAQPMLDHRVLEFGTGSGYHSAVLSRLVR